MEREVIHRSPYCTGPRPRNPTNQLINDTNFAMPGAYDTCCAEVEEEGEDEEGDEDERRAERQLGPDSIDICRLQFWLEKQVEIPF